MKRLVLALPLAVLALASSTLHAQEEKNWALEGELGASVFFGASDQTAALFRTKYSRTSDKLEFSTNGSFDYGEAQVEGGPAVVNKRSWGAGLTLDYEVGRWSPFVFGTGEGSFERQIDLRLSGGVGTRFGFIDNGNTRIDISVAVLAERTQPRAAPGQPSVDAETLARWENRFRATHEFMGGRTNFALVAFYKPAFEDTSDYTVDLETSLAFALNGSLSFKVSLVDKYDSLAESRGATSNNDGRLFFSVVAPR